MLLEHEKQKVKDAFKSIGFILKLEDIKRLYIEFILESFDWNRTRAAKALGVPLRTLRDWIIRKKSIEIPEEKVWKKSNSGKK